MWEPAATSCQPGIRRHAVWEATSLTTCRASHDRRECAVPTRDHDARVLDHATLGRLVSAHGSDLSPTRPLGGSLHDVSPVPARESCESTVLRGLRYAPPAARRRCPASAVV